MALEVLLAQTMEALGLLQPHRVLAFRPKLLKELSGRQNLERAGKALTEHPPYCMDAGGDGGGGGGGGGARWQL